MKLAEYNEILESFTDGACDGTAESLQQIQSKFPNVSHASLVSIYSQHFQMITRQTLHHHNSPDMIAYYVQMYQARVAGNPTAPILAEIAKEAHLPPVMIARIIVEGLQGQVSNQEVPKSMVTQLLREPYLIADPVLAYQVQICTLQDLTYGPYAESIKHSVGNEYEFLLVQLLKERNISFLQEDDMRKKGYDKTPDTKLEVPVAWNGHIINWIESKASFGDKFSHENYLKDQYLSYANRFGSGLVIYWHGFIEELATGCMEQGIALADRLPEDLTFLKPR
ncbi:CDAN1-interacting nuclease 1-like isoform X1 [Diadema setosum]|uniref:CDAN1-interacting nuclease 1-like isoform X1 n=2 Tax=Diadema setosum TaxID=31175 RepID=UPI003B3B350F